MRWDEEADAELRRLAQSGIFIPEMARTLGRTQEAIRTRANLLGIPVRTSAPRRASQPR